MLSEFEVYKSWVALHAHFNSKSYDFIKNEGRVRAKFKTFISRNDYKIFKYAKYKDTRELLSWFLAYVSINRGRVPHITELLNFRTENSKEFGGWKSKINNLETTFETDLGNMYGYSLKELFHPESGKPVALSLYEQKEISIETLYILNEITSIFSVWDHTIKPDLIWKQQKQFIIKYGKFLNIDVNKLKQIFDNFKDITRKE